MKSRVLFVLLVTVLALLPGCRPAQNISSDAPSQEMAARTGSGIIETERLSDAIMPPDQIIFYDHGEKTQINKGDARYDQVFSLITKMTATVDDQTKCAFTSDDEAQLKQNGAMLEMRYFSPLQISWHARTWVYDTIYIPIGLKDGCNDFMVITTFIYDPAKNVLSTVGPTGPADDLLLYLRGGSTKSVE